VTSPVEYTLTRNREGRYCVAIDGKWAVPEFGSADDARAWVMAHARTTQQRGAGISECFDRCAQLVQGPRGGWNRFNSAHEGSEKEKRT
jgi:hypothetical protein